MKELSLKKEIRINASTADVWRALTNPEVLKKTMFGSDVITDWQVGSPITFRGEWNGTSFVDKGTILDFEKGRHYEYNYWSNFSGLADAPENYSIIKIGIEEAAAETLLILEHRNFATQTMYEHSDKNWDVALNSLKESIEGK